MLRWIVARFTAALTILAILTTFTGCDRLSPEQTESGQEIGPVTPNGHEISATSNDNVPKVFVDRSEFTSLQQLLWADLIIEGTITGENTRFIPDASATNAELAERQAQGLPTGVFVTDYQVTIDNVLKGQVDSTSISVVPAIRIGEDDFKVGDRAILFLRDISGDPIQAPGQTKYAVIAPEGQFRIEKDNTLFTFRPEPFNPLLDTYRGKDKDVLVKDIQNLVAQLPQPTKEEVLKNALNSTDLVIEGTIQGVHEVHFINALEKTQAEIDQMLAEGKMPGLLLTDYTVSVDKVLFDKYVSNPRFFPNWRSLEPGQTIIVTRQGGTYQGVTQIEEPGPPFEIGSREILFLSGFSLINYDVPDDGQARYSTDSRLGRFLIGADNTLTAFTPKDLGGAYTGLDLGQLEQDITEFLKTQPLNENVPAPPQP